MHSTAIERPIRGDRPGWGNADCDNDDGSASAEGSAAFRPLTRQEAQALRLAQPPLSPWRVVRWQAAVGVGVALLSALLGRPEWAWSALYGAAVVVVPGGLIARGMTSRLSSLSPGASAVSVMVWTAVKIAVSVAMLVLATRIVQALVWPALLAGLVLCLNVYWLALLWRPGRKQSN